MKTNDRAREQALTKAIPLVCRAATDGPAPQLFATDGQPVTSQLRDELLAKCRSGEYVELDVELLAYEQRPGVANRNFVRFRDGAMVKLGSSFRGKPFLRDHEQNDVTARAGTITKSQTEKRGEGDYAIRMTARLTAPWAVELALRDLLSSASIGWHPSGPIECSVCGTAIGTKCYHWPGDRLSEQADDEGVKRYVRDRKGNLVVEWVYTDADGTECSTVNVPAVPSAGIESVRAALAAAFGDSDRDETEPPDAHADGPRTQFSNPPAHEEEPQHMTTKNAPATEPDTQPTTAAQQPTQAEIDARVDARVQQRRADERTLSALIARHKIDIDVGKLLDEHKTVDAAKLEILKRLTDEQPAVNAAHSGVSIGAEASDKKREVIERALLAKMSGEKPKDKDVERYARMGLLAIGDELFEDAGISSRELRDVMPQDRAKLMLGMRLPIGVNRKLAGPGINSTSDFPLIIGSVFNQRMRALYQQRTQAWKAFALKENLPSFDEVPIYMGGRFPALLPVAQGGAYQRGSFQMSDMSVRLGKAGRIVSLTWELILADRIGLIDRAINDRVNAALRWEDSLFYAKLVLNKMADGSTDIYGSDNTATGGAISVTTLGSGFVKMATRETEDGDPIVAPGEEQTAIYAANVRPRYWLTPVLQEINAQTLLGDGYQPTAASGAPTPAMKALTVIGDGNLDANSITASYLFADPSDAVTVQYGHLASEDGPVLEEENGFTVDGKDYKVRHTAYVEFVDNVGTVKMPIS